MPLAAVGWGLADASSAFLHTRRSETQIILMNIAFIAVAVFIAWGRFGDYPL
ncbi:MAG: hypothetical protein OEM32_07955 [Acidimicrobiia bacterium]|nr:hypothetical protein [Acidimicrobiia bacterium]